MEVGECGGGRIWKWEGMEVGECGEGSVEVGGYGGGSVEVYVSMHKECSDCVESTCHCNTIGRQYTG